MDQENLSLLDNPVWQSLHTDHSGYAEGSSTLLRYPSHVLPFIACEDPKKANLNDIERWATIGEKFYLVGDLPPVPPNWVLHPKLDCMQMVWTKSENLIPDKLIEIEQLEENDYDSLLELVNFVQPGYFYRETPSLGRYFGIKRHGQLLAVAGERLSLPGFTEISAVCTHPGYTGRGYAKQLLIHLIRLNVHEKSTPFLHVLYSNTRAISLYEMLGFKHRRSMAFWPLTLSHY